MGFVGGAAKCNVIKILIQAEIQKGSCMITPLNWSTEPTLFHVHYTKVWSLCAGGCLMSALPGHVFRMSTNGGWSKGV